MCKESETVCGLEDSKWGWMGLTSSPGLFLGWALDCRLAVWDGRRTLVFRSHRQGWVALTTREVQRLPLMARIFSCARQRCCLRSAGIVTFAACPRPLAAMVLLPSIGMWSERGERLPLVV